MQRILHFSIALYSECSHIVAWLSFVFQFCIYLMWPFLQRFRTPLLIAAIEGHSDVVSLLLERGADKEARDTEVSTLSSLQTNGARSGVTAHRLAGFWMLLGRFVL